MINNFYLNINLPNLHFEKLKILFIFIKDISKDKNQRLGNKWQRKDDHEKAHFHYMESLREGNHETIIPLAELCLSKWLDLEFRPCDLEPMIADVRSNGFNAPILKFFLKKMAKEMKKYDKLKSDGAELDF